MLQGIGIDIIKTDRFKNVKNKKNFLHQVFTTHEFKQGKEHSNTNRSWARIFTIKEAIFKAFKSGLHHGSYWHDVELKDDHTIILSGYFKARFKNTTKVFTAQTGSKRYAVSIALVQE